MPDQGTVEVTYDVYGGDSGPQTNTFTISGGKASFDSEEDLSTSAHPHITVKATGVTYDPAQ